MKRLIKQLIERAKPAPLTFAERREIVQRNWQRYGYGNRPVLVRLNSFETLAQKIDALMLPVLKQA